MLVVVIQVKANPCCQGVSIHGLLRRRTLIGLVSLSGLPSSELDATEFGPFRFSSVNTGPTINHHAAVFLTTLHALENFALNRHIKASYPNWSELMQPAE